MFRKALSFKPRFKRLILLALNGILEPLSYTIVHRTRLVDFYLHSYGSYDEYRDVQVFHNKRKLDSVWSDETTLGVICDELQRLFPDRPLNGLCHGTRNGFEQRFFSEQAGYHVIGTEISDTAGRFENTVQWDFHDVNPDWVSKFDFVYSNSLDQAWSPRAALTTWLNQLTPEGVLVIEHTEAHGPEGASEMDPFGVRPTVMPYVLSDWFGWDISVKFLRSRKDNNGLDVWIFVIRRNVPIIE